MALVNKWKDASVEVLNEVIDEAFQELGYSKAKQEQKEAVRSILEGQDLFISFPTEFGKSAVFQVLPTCASLLIKATSSDYSLSRLPCVLVVSPLISLMADQAKKLHDRKFKAVARLSEEAPEATFQDLLSGKVTHILASPEALLSTKWRKLLLEPKFVDNIVAVAVDEAHCIMKWYVY